jgi:transmembrane sensor
MDDLIVKRLRGEATDIEIRKLDRWRAESSANESEYRAFVDLWDQAAEAASAAIRPPPAVEEIVKRGDARRARDRARATRRAVLLSPWTGFGLAATAAAIVIFLNFPSDVDRTGSTHGLFPVESSSGPGDVTTLGLSDGSVVRMMPETRMEFPATADRREVSLEGRAFFAVTADPLPFVIRTRLGEVTVHGTRFEVRAAGDQLRLVVVEGTVHLDGESGPAEVGPGQIAYLNPSSPPRILDHNDVWSVLEWVGGLLIYESTPLSMVTSELSRHFDREVSLLDEALGGIRITAWFEDESIEEVVSAVCLVAGVPCELGEERVTIGR